MHCYFIDTDIGNFRADSRKRQLGETYKSFLKSVFSIQPGREFQQHLQGLLDKLDASSRCLKLLLQI